MRRYVLLAGVNGAGKSTLFSLLPSLRDIERRYVESLENIKAILQQCDLAAIYDNTVGFRRFAIYKSGKCIRLSTQTPLWYQQTMCEDDR